MLKVHIESRNVGDKYRCLCIHMNKVISNNGEKMKKAIDINYVEHDLVPES